MRNNRGASAVAGKINHGTAVPCRGKANGNPFGSVLVDVVSQRSANGSRQSFLLPPSVPQGSWLPLVDLNPQGLFAIRWYALQACRTLLRTIEHRPLRDGALTDRR